MSVIRSMDDHSTKSTVKSRTFVSSTGWAQQHFNSFAGALNQHICINLSGFPFHHSKLPNWHVGGKLLLQSLHGQSNLWGHKPYHFFHQVHHPPLLLPRRLHLLHSISEVLPPCKLPHEHAGFKHTRQLRPNCSDKRQQFLVCWPSIALLCHHIAAVDLRAHSDVRLLCVCGGRTSFS